MTATAATAATTTVRDYISIDDGPHTFTDTDVMGTSSTHLLIRVRTDRCPDSYAILDARDPDRIRETHHTIYADAAWSDLWVTDTTDDDLRIDLRPPTPGQDQTRRREATGQQAPA